ncbi:PP0621 family protein [Aromatoleum buckelii]|uniref:Preprotein translocase subunit YajC n=1 Tax=Aromatoleum buckelii TaxID=200254 RepID=A0ABX1MWW5_9RHOO|nr:PP0621 family protein [Aromatoleum buckelii]MCK0510555.1 hypothetical protein [Aromatoleum buckelii]
MRNLLIFILVLVVIWWVRRALSKPRGSDPRAAGRRGGPKNAPEPMLACDQCGVHVPESEGVHDDNGFFCCEEHRRLGVRR